MESLLHELFIIALLSTAVTYACHKVKIPSIVGFLLTGAVFGPYSLKLVQNADSVQVLADIGIVFLLFSIGLELSLGELVRLKKAVFVGGTLQVCLTIGVFTGLAFWFLPTMQIGSAVFVGFLIALSSTAIVLKALQQKAMIESPAGRISVAILIFQDVVIVPMMLAIPLLAGHAKADMRALALAGGQTLLLIGGIFFAAKKVVPWLLQIVIKTKSREVFLITILGICLGTAYLTSHLGLSLSLGAFMAGLVVAESEYSSAALDGILPFRDVFTSIFFISVGMLLDVHFFFEHLLLIGAITALVLGIKALIAGGDALLLGYPIRPAIIVGLALCQVGEFSFVLAKEGLRAGLLSQDHYQLFLAASILTMAATPFLITASKKAAEAVAVALNGKAAKEDEEGQSELTDHLIIIGYGMGGRLLARAAKAAGVPYNVLEMNPDTVRKYKQEGEPIEFGDATHAAMLMHLGITRARVLCLVVSDPAAVRNVTELARLMNPHVHILVRTRFMAEVPVLQGLGATSVIAEEFETGIEIFTRVLATYLVPQDIITTFTNEVRAENYDMLRKREVLGTSFKSLQKQIPDLAVSVFRVQCGAFLDGLTLQEATLRQKAKLTVVAVKRDEEVFAHPGGNFCLQANDLVYVFSAPKEAADAASWFTAR